MIVPALLKILRCPETHQPLRPAAAPLIETLNQQITAGQLCNHAGAIVALKIDAGLVREDAKLLYPIRNQLPILLVDEAIPLVAKQAG